MVRAIAATAGAVPFYDAASNQFGFPKISALWGMSGDLLPWWGWLLIGQAVFVYALFEYVRRGLATPPVQNENLDARLRVLEGSSPDFGHLGVLENAVERLAKLDPRVEALERLQREIIDDYQRMSGLEARFSDMLDGLKDGIAQKNLSSASNHGVLQDKLSELQKALEAFTGRQAALDSLTADDVAIRLKTVFDAIGAIYHRERLIEMADRLEKGAKELQAPTTVKKHYDADEWGVWKSHEEAWRRVLEQWCDLADNYVSGLSGKILTVADSHYTTAGVADVGQFPIAEDYIEYKRFCGRLKNWHNWQEEARRAVHQAAFNGGGRQPMAGAGYLEELGGTA